MNNYGKKVWLIADAYYPNGTSKLKYVSHEAVCILNTSDEDAKINISLYFEDREPQTDYIDFCNAKRTKHIRMDKIKDSKGKGVPIETPYAILVTSSIPVICQYSRLDTTQSKMSIATTMAYSID